MMLGAMNDGMRQPVSVFARPLVRALLLQVGLLVFFFGLFLDFGESLRSCCYLSIVFWLGTIIILIRRPQNPTRGDLAYIRWGLLLIVLLGIPALWAVWHFKAVYRTNASY
jgi:hypothetical protein